MALGYVAIMFRSNLTKPLADHCESRQAINGERETFRRESHCAKLVMRPLFYKLT